MRRVQGLDLSGVEFDLPLAELQEGVDVIFEAWKAVAVYVVNRVGFSKYRHKMTFVLPFASQIYDDSKATPLGKAGGNLIR